MAGSQKGTTMRTITLSIGALLFASISQATTIYNNGGPGSNFILGADEGYPQFVADNFILDAGRNVVTEVSWWGVYPESSLVPTDDFTISIYDVILGSPDWDQVPALSPLIVYDIAAVTRRRTQLTERWTGASVYAYTALIGPIELAPATTYYLSITNNTHRLGSGWAWSDHDYGSFRTGYMRNALDDPWRQNGVEMAFYLSSDQIPVAEPATAILMGLGLGFLGVLRGRFRRSSD